MSVFLERAEQHRKARANMIQRRLLLSVYGYVNNRPEFSNILKILQINVTRTWYL